MNTLREARKILNEYAELNVVKKSLEAVIADPYNHPYELRDVCKMLSAEKTIIPKAITLLGKVKEDMAELERENV